MVVRAVLVIAIIAASGAYAHRLSTHRSAVTGLPALDQLPRTFSDGWVSTDEELPASVAAILDADVTLQRVYWTDNGEQVFLFVAYFKEQQVNSQIHSPRHCVPGGGWAVASHVKTSVELPSGTVPAARMHVVRQGKGRDLVYWFRTRGGVVSGEYALKWDLIQNSIAQRPTDAVFVRFSALTENVELMHDMMRRLDQPLNEILAEVGL